MLHDEGSHDLSLCCVVFLCRQVVEWLGAVLEELDFQNEAKNQTPGLGLREEAAVAVIACLKPSRS